MMAGKDADLDAAAALLGACALPVIAGLRTDVAGAAAAIRLAARLGGALDHADAEAGLRDVAVLRDRGLMLVSPGEARRRADAVLIVGDASLAAWPEAAAFLFGAEGAPRPDSMKPPRILRLPHAPGGIGDRLGALRARVNGRPTACPAAEQAALDEVAALMRAARYGVALWSPGEIDALAIEMLSGLVKDLNETTRWAGLSICSDMTAPGALMAAAWMTGLPFRIGFGRGRAEHDPWRFEARRLVESGEADAVLWIAGPGENPPDWLGAVPAVILSDASPASTPTRIGIRVGRPGVDHDGLLYDRRLGALARVDAIPAAPDATRPPSVAEALNAIAEKLAAA